MFLHYFCHSKQEYTFIGCCEKFFIILQILLIIKSLNQIINLYQRLPASSLLLSNAWRWSIGRTIWHAVSDKTCIAQASALSSTTSDFSPSLPSSTCLHLWLLADSVIQTNLQNGFEVCINKYTIILFSRSQTKSTVSLNIQAKKYT